MSNLPALLACLLMSMLGSTACRADLIWWDGSRQAGDNPPGELLSDTVGYYGDSIRTGVDYTYEAQPDVRPDATKSPRDVQGRLLLDGNPMQSVARRGPISVVFDFKRNCTFSEIDVCSKSRSASIKIETAGQPGKWTKVYERRVDFARPDRPSAMHHFADYIDAYPGVAMQRIALPDRPQGRYVRLSVEAPDTTDLGEVVVWGDAEVTKENPEQFNPVIKTMAPLPWCQFSIPGIDKTGIVFNEFADWKQRIGEPNKLRAVWSQVPTWDGITEGPIMPDRARINQPVRLLMARNETECAAIALTNILWPDKINTEIKLSGFRRIGDSKPAPKIRAKLRVAGAIPSSIFGVVIGPLFEPDNMPGLGVMRRYVTNADGIHDFPKVSLPEMTSVVTWLSVTTEGAAPGVYEAELTCTEPDTKPLKIRAEVLDVTVPKSFAWICSYSSETRQFPFEYSDRPEREAAYRNEIALNVYHGFPEPGTVMEAARKYPNTVYGVIPLPDKYRKASLSESDTREIQDGIKKAVAHAKELGLEYDQWYLELWDEPNGEALKAYEPICKIMHEADPKLRIYCNPFSGTPGQWYNKEIAASAPRFSMRHMDTPESRAVYRQPRWINGYYVVATNSAKGERTYALERYRRFAWESMLRDWNGWGFFAYYQPVGDPWNDFDAESPDFLLAYPGPRGPIATRASEVVREGYEDYCLMDLLRKQGKKRDVQALLKGYQDNLPLSVLHQRALKAAARKK